MSRFSYLGLNFHFLAEDNLETLRQWRNADHLRPFMHDKRVITEDAQRNWFASINNLHHVYLLVESEETLFGCMSLKNIDFGQGSCEIGSMIGLPDYLETVQSALAQIGMIDLAFRVYGMNEVHGHVLKNNVRAIDNYRFFGGEIVKELSQSSVLIRSTKTSYMEARGLLIKSLDRLGVDADSIMLYRNDSSEPTSAEIHFKKLVSQSRLKFESR